MGTGIFSVRTTRLFLRKKFRQVLSSSENAYTHKRTLIDLKGSCSHSFNYRSTLHNVNLAANLKLAEIELPLKTVASRDDIHGYMSVAGDNSILASLHHSLSTN